MGKKSLLLIWQDKKSRLYFHVGTLTYDGDLYLFEYTHQIKANRRVHDAISYGYSLHPAFPDLKKKYKSKKLFPAFARRIPSPNRNDYEDVLSALSLPVDVDKMDLLRATRGMIGQNPYTFAEPLRLTEGNILKNSFYISGMRYSGLSDFWYKSIQIGDELILERDINNPVDTDAVKIFTGEGVHLGYVPGVFAGAIGALIDRNVAMNVVVEDIKPNFSSQWWIRVSYQSTLELHHDIVELYGLVVPAA